ncbi:MAG: Stp1/IreP family PP2C-type Ser/Thr phosphatase [Deltaproteobacteria bacterium]|nr:Stp1/IreP family PP2C-type Ser/Thr phosphatase [Deltaproteobacteria bacterium]
MLGESMGYQGLRSSAPREDAPAAITDVGCEREINEDRYAVLESNAGRMWVVCDGMGGVQGGELAAQLALDAMRRGLESRTFNTPEEALFGAIEEANRRIVLRKQNPQFGGMGTTVVAAIEYAGEVVIGSAGDSRAYLVRAGEIQQLTTDHTYVQDLVERGMISAQEALTHPQAHVLTRCLGAEPRLDMDTTRFWIWDTAAGEVNDRLVLCSDGLYSHVSDEEIASIISNNSPQDACVKLVEAAKKEGGYDNITVAVLPIHGQLREEAPPEPQRAARVAAVSQGSQAKAARVPWSRQLMIMFFLAIIGAVVTTLLVLWQASAG